MPQYPIDDGDNVVVNLSSDISIGELILALEHDPRFAAMVIRVQAKSARNTGSPLNNRYSKPPVANASLIQPVAPNRLQ